MSGLCISLIINFVHRFADPKSIVVSHLFYGTARIAHIYNRLYNYFGNPLFKEASNYRFDRTINRFSTELESGFKARESKFESVENDGLLEGYTGIGLVLISAISDIEPKRDRCLLLS